MTVAVEANPTVARRKLAVYFRRLREQHGVGLNEVATLLGVDLSQASRLDTGARGLRAEDVRRLCHEYGLSAGEEVSLLTLAEEARRRAWWQQYEIAPSLRTLIGMEQAALSIGEYAGNVVPGLLQTRGYAQAASVTATDVPPQKLADVVTVRMRRQQILEREQPPDLWAVIDEAVLARVAGGPAVMRDQLEHLLARANEPGVTVQVIGFEYGLYPGGGNHFILLGMEDGLPDVLYTEDLRARFDTTEAAELTTARRVWDDLRALALSPKDSLVRIQRYIDSLSDHQPAAQEDEQQVHPGAS